MFVRAGSILATNAVADDTDDIKPAEVLLDIYPSATRASFTCYEDDGATYAYEKGVFFRQEITAQQVGGSIAIQLHPPSGTFKPAVKTYLLRIHGTAAASVKVGGIAWQRSEEDAPHRWQSGTDRFGPVTTLTIEAGRAAAVALR